MLNKNNFIEIDILREMELVRKLRAKIEENNRLLKWHLNRIRILRARKKEA